MKFENGVLFMYIQTHIDGVKAFLEMIHTKFRLKVTFGERKKRNEVRGATYKVLQVCNVLLLFKKSKTNMQECKGEMQLSGRYDGWIFITLFSMLIYIFEPFHKIRRNAWKLQRGDHTVPNCTKNVSPFQHLFPTL